MRHGRVLGIDAGERRVGVALSDEMGMLASPLAVLDRAHGLPEQGHRMADKA